MEVNFKEIEEKWQKKWEESKIFEVKENSSKKKFYVLEMFPYPSATGLHMGHAFNFVIGDIYARFKKMQGFNVLHPMGFDALGLPAENAAIKEGINPSTYTQNSVKNFINQQKKLGIGYDWSRKIDTSQPEYYKWDQWIFLQMYKKGLVYKKKAAVNWCPSCQTIIANEQAQGGECERCHTKIEIKQMDQWFLKITDYADRLLEGHKNLNWPEKTIAMQKNWIGKSYGTEIDFEINGEKWPIFTTRPDTIFGVTFMVISAQHPKIMNLATKEQEENVKKFLEKIGSVSEKELEEMEKEGVFTGSYAINPANNEKVPVYVGNFVVADYGCGMVMAVPAHDQRDFEFAKKYKIPIKQVIEGKITEKRAWTENGKIINSKQFNGLNNEEAKEKITQWLIEKKVARKVVNYKLRDWSVARQRYWGTPIPLIHCEKCGVVPVPEKDLPVVLPKNVKFGKGNPLETNEEWLNVKCPSCGEKARREANTMDTFVNSSWYFFRYCDPKNDKEIFSKEKTKYWMPVDLYIGGAEHACMHLIYERFYTMFLHDIGLTDIEEATPRLFHQGMINDEKGEKMSKSKGNTVEPLEIIEKYGTDTTRFYLMSEASPDKGFNWTDKGINGALKFTKNILKIFEEIKIGKTNENFENEINKAIKSITNYIENIDYRKATIEIRRIFELLEKQKEVSKENLESILKLLAPFCPHIAEEIWEKLGNKPFISIEEWPKAKEIKEKKKEEDLNNKIISEIKPILEKFPEKNKVCIYVLPFEIEKIDEEKIKKELKKEIFVYSVKDSSKYDPQNKSKKALPGKPSFWVE